MRVIESQNTLHQVVFGAGCLDVNAVCFCILFAKTGANEKAVYLSFSRLMVRVRSACRSASVVRMLLSAFTISWRR